MKAPGTYDSDAFEEHLHNDIMKFMSAVAVVLTMADIIVLVFS